MDEEKLQCEEMEKKIEILMQDCDRLKADIEKQDSEMSELKEEAMNSFAAFEDESSSLSQQKKLLYCITRLTWDDKALRKNLIKGYVYNTQRRDVSVFSADPAKTACKTTVSNLLWDYISQK